MTLDLIYLFKIERFKCSSTQPKIPGNPIVTDQSQLPEKTMRDSYQEASIPIGSNTMLRDKYLNFHEEVRIGRLLEDLDTMAGKSYGFNDPQVSCSLSTILRKYILQIYKNHLMNKIYY